MKTLLESSAIIEYLRGNQKVKEIIDKSEDFYVSSLSVFEVLIGKVKEKDILDFLSAFKVLNVTRKDAVLASRIFKRLKDKGKIIGAFDIIIASQAINKDLTLVTKDFLRVKEEFKELELV